jgi:hypothetical protein
MNALDVKNFVKTMLIIDTLEDTPGCVIVGEIKLSKKEAIYYNYLQKVRKETQNTTLQSILCKDSENQTDLAILRLKILLSKLPNAKYIVFPLKKIEVRFLLLVLLKKFDFGDNRFSDVLKYFSEIMPEKDLLELSELVNSISEAKCAFSGLCGKMLLIVYDIVKDNPEKLYKYCIMPALNCDSAIEKLYDKIGLSDYFICSLRISDKEKTKPERLYFAKYIGDNLLLMEHYKGRKAIDYLLKKSKLCEVICKNANNGAKKIAIFTLGCKTIEKNIMDVDFEISVHK